MKAVGRPIPFNRVRTFAAFVALSIPMPEIDYFLAASPLVSTSAVSRTTEFSLGPGRTVFVASALSARSAPKSVSTPFLAVGAAFRRHGGLY